MIFLFPSSFSILEEERPKPKYVLDSFAVLFISKEIFKHNLVNILIEKFLFLDPWCLNLPHQRFLKGKGWILT